MRFLVDESTGASVVAYLRNAGHDVIAVLESMPQATDEDILSYAASDDRILVTNDKDFGDLVFREQAAHHGVILLRLREDLGANRLRVVEHLLTTYAHRLAGSFTVATEEHVRIRPILRVI